ncbi:uncharacterized protein LOC113221804 [Piliocolobus tephrosceles]|uniref:uncharacterized protein LOC113221804 n=1 Tax=Piliocolobus tephrosceles TaxID=591936 RepID=UPI000E6B3F28|nr:uncharacterized protein LOC113221804 [Piliocolobus tephrosceles]
MYPQSNSEASILNTNGASILNTNEASILNTNGATQGLQHPLPPKPRRLWLEFLPKSPGLLLLGTPRHQMSHWQATPGPGLRPRKLLLPPHNPRDLSGLCPGLRKEAPTPIPALGCHLPGKIRPLSLHSPPEASAPSPSWFLVSKASVVFNLQEISDLLSPPSPTGCSDAPKYSLLEGQAPMATQRASPGALLDGATHPTH